MSDKVGLAMPFLVLFLRQEILDPSLCAALLLSLSYYLSPRMSLHAESFTAILASQQAAGQNKVT